MTDKARLLKHLEVFADTVCTPSERDDEMSDEAVVAAEACACVLDGVIYMVTVERTADGRTHVSFTSDPAPEGLDRRRYEWTGRLPTQQKLRKAA